MLPAPDSRHEFIQIGGPDKWLWPFVVFVKEAVDGSLKVDEQAQDDALQAAVGPSDEEPLDGLQR